MRCGGFSGHRETSSGWLAGWLGLALMRNAPEFHATMRARQQPSTSSYNGYTRRYSAPFIHITQPAALCILYAALSPHNVALRVGSSASRKNAVVVVVCGCCAIVCGATSCVSMSEHEQKRERERDRTPNVKVRASQSSQLVPLRVLRFGADAMMRRCVPCLGTPIWVSLCNFIIIAPL